MSRAAQDPPRMVTRSMAQNTARRSVRLRVSHEKRRSLSQSPLPQGLDTSDLRQRAKRRTQPTVKHEGDYQTKSHRACGQVEVRLERKARRVGSRDGTVSRGPSSQTTKPASCNQKSSRVRELEERLDTALQAKEELTARIEEYNINTAQSTLKHLEEYFTCPLCFEIMACPYTLIPRNCGHTFCATCILKWFFSRLHKGCGGWHEAVYCPLCRSSLPPTPEQTPRSASCFPFVPNRTADVAILGLINTISHELGDASTVASTSLLGWNDSGHGKQEWSKRERAGKTEMTAIAAQWNTLKPTDFVNIKSRLEV